MEKKKYKLIMKNEKIIWKKEEASKFMSGIHRHICNNKFDNEN